MPRDEDEINYELVIREKKQDTSALKSILQQLFSGVGLVVICVFIAIFGKWIYFHELEIIIFKISPDRNCKCVSFKNNLI